jgi:hypothetical protein
MKNTVKKVAVLLALLLVSAFLILTLFHHEPKAAALSRKARERIEALDDALKNGLISQSEYKKRVAQIQEDDANMSDPANRDENEDGSPADSGSNEKERGTSTSAPVNSAAP